MDATPETGTLENVLAVERELAERVGFERRNAALEQLLRRLDHAPVRVASQVTRLEHARDVRSCCRRHLGNHAHDLETGWNSTGRRIPGHAAM